MWQVYSLSKMFFNYSLETLTYSRLIVGILLKEEIVVFTIKTLFYCYHLKKNQPAGEDNCFEMVV